MTTFKVFSVGCPRCQSAASALKAAIAERQCGCNVQEVSCDGTCDTAKSHGFAGQEWPVIMRDDTVVHQGPLSKEEATTLLPA